MIMQDESQSQDVYDLRRALRSSIEATRSTGAKLIRSFIAYSGLTLSHIPHF